jgi:type I restriction enzyme S subunit
MNMMEKIRLGDLCIVVSGTTPKTGNAEFWNGNLPWITPAELTEDSFIVKDTVRKITKAAVKGKGLKSFPKGTVLLSSRAPIGKVALAGMEMYCNQGFKNLICKENLHNEYLYWFLKGKKEYLNSLGRGATFKEISKGIVEDVKIPLPDKDVQIHISKVLNKLQNLIRCRNEQLGQLDDLVKSRFIEMFGDPYSNEKGWNTISLDDITTIVTYGLTVRPKFIDEGIDLISARELRSGIVEYEKSPKISKTDFLNLSEKAKPLKDEILFSKTGSIGHCALITSDRKFAVTQNAARIGLSLDMVNPIWVLYYLKMDFIQKWCQNHAKGNAVKDFQIQDIKRIPIFDCNIELQNQYAEFFQQVDKLKSEVQNSLNETQVLFDSLMQEYFD